MGKQSFIKIMKRLLICVFHPTSPKQLAWGISRSGVRLPFFFSLRMLCQTKESTLAESPLLPFSGTHIESWMNFSLNKWQTFHRKLPHLSFLHFLPNTVLFHDASCACIVPHASFIQLDFINAWTSMIRGRLAFYWLLPCTLQLHVLHCRLKYIFLFVVQG